MTPTEAKGLRVKDSLPKRVGIQRFAIITAEPLRYFHFVLFSTVLSLVVFTLTISVYNAFISGQFSDELRAIPGLLALVLVFGSPLIGSSFFVACTLGYTVWILSINYSTALAPFRIVLFISACLVALVSIWVGALSSKIIFDITLFERDGLYILILVSLLASLTGALLAQFIYANALTQDNTTSAISEDET